jgi:large subunit ribosomal protein L15
MPLPRRVPKRGFTNIFKKQFQIVNLSALSGVGPQPGETTENLISPRTLKQVGLIGKENVPVKILGNGEIGKAVTVQANAFSKKAKEKIEAAGGKIEVIKC